MKEKKVYEGIGISSCGSSGGGEEEGVYFQSVDV